MASQCSLSEAAALIADGERVAVSGGMDMAPMALVRELIRRGVRRLHVIGSGSVAIGADLLVGAGCAETIELSHIAIGEFGFAPRFRQAAERGEIRTLDHTCPGIAAALQAGAWGLPFMPVRGLLGTDYLRVRPEFRTIANPYNPEEEIVVVPAIRPDAALFHGYEADTDGNVVASPLQNNKLLAQASRRTIVTVERIVRPGELDRGKGTFIPAAFVTHVAEAPGGAYPTACPGLYEADAANIQAYVEAAKTEEGFRGYLERTLTMTTGGER